tara:strand:+ start:145 stop:606 length:462 start_codon:yes stop_codon:yes gene_type:complete
MHLKTRIKNSMKHLWLYKGKEFLEEMIPEDAVGFVYEMQAIIDGKHVKYIGKKNFYSKRKKKFGKKALAAITDKRTKKYEIVTKLDYQKYFSSNKVLKDAHKKGIIINRNILVICYSKTELTYQETKLQFINEVLEKDEFLNANILGRFYKQK